MAFGALIGVLLGIQRDSFCSVHLITVNRRCTHLDNNA